MKTLILSAVLCLSAMFQLNAQTVFRVELQHDTVGLNEYFEVRYVLENADLQNFTAPNFDDFQVVAGPSTFTSMSIVNGKTTRSTAYSYHLKPKSVGVFELPMATAKTSEGVLYASAITITVKEDFERRQAPSQNNPFNFDFGNSPFGGDFFKGGGKDFFGQDFNSIFDQMPSMEDMMRQWEQLFQTPMQPQQKPKKEEKTYKL